jgi:hypothetical protein|tara:strand:+ start:19176 stop:19451 length:276 start_codon:yes stop_codon:yes gene_type:complete
VFSFPFSDFRQVCTVVTLLSVVTVVTVVTVVARDKEWLPLLNNFCILVDGFVAVTGAQETVQFGVMLDVVVLQRILRAIAKIATLLCSGTE